MNLDFDPDSISAEPKRVVRWVALEREERALSAHVSAEEVIKSQTLFETNTLPLRDPDCFVAGQLHQCVSEWNCILDENSNEASADVRSWIKHGLDIHDFFTHFHGNFKGNTYNSDKPPRQYFPNAAICRQYSSFIMHELYEGLRSRSIKLIGNVGECKCPKVIMPLTVEPSKPRLCHDERFLNLWIKDCPFQLETLKDFHRLVERDSKMIACDEKSGYSHLSITNSSQTYFGFQFGGWLFCYTTLPFGFKAAAFTYQTVGMQVTSYLRTLGMSTMQYIDDRMSATAVSCLSECNHNVCMTDASKMVYVLLEVMTRLGYTLSLKKSQLIPSTKIKFLGFYVDSEKEAFILPDDKKDKFVALREKILSSNTVDVRTLQRFAGKCISMYLALPCSKFFSRQVNTAISVCLKNSRDVKVEGDLRTELEFWRFLDTWQGHAQWRAERHRQIVLATDSSGYKYGAKILSGDHTGEEIGDFWQSGDSRPIHVKEADAVLQCLTAIENEVQDARIDLFCDNTAVVYAWQNQGCRDPMLNNVLKKIFQLVCDKIMHLLLKYIHTSNNPADAPSRSISFTDCMLQENIWARIDNAFGPHTVDLMATDSNVMHSQTGAPLRHFTQAFSPRSAGVNVFAQDISREDNPYVFPPFHLIFPLLCLLREQKVKACTFVAPVYQIKPIWWPMLMRHTAASISLGHVGDSGILYIPSRLGFIKDKLGLREELKAFRLHFD